MFWFKEIVLDFPAGASIKSVISRAIGVSSTHYYADFGHYEGALVKIDINGVMVSVKSDSDPELIYRDWSRAGRGYIEKSVGPYPNPVLTDEEKESDARIEAYNEQCRQWLESKPKAS